MRSLLDGITSALRNQQAITQQQPPQPRVDVIKDPKTWSEPNAPPQPLDIVLSTVPPKASQPTRYGTCAFAAEAPPEMPFSMLLLSQNMGGIDPLAHTKSSTEWDGDESPKGVAENTLSLDGVPEGTRRDVHEFLTELRQLIHELSRREFRTQQRRDGKLFSTESSAALPPLVDVIVIHFQEIGGRRMHTDFNAYFTEALGMLLPEAGWTSGLMMEPNNETQRFTAMGSIIFLSPRMCPISSLLSFRHRTFVAVADDPRTYGSSPTFLFHGNKFANAGNSRKGFLLTSLRLGTVVVNFLNLHLNHDTSNTVAAQPPSPSSYAFRRQESLLEALAESVAFVSPQDPIFIFGDFNTRLDAHGFLRHMRDTHRIEVELDTKDVRAPDRFWECFANAQQLVEVRRFDAEMQRLLDVAAQQSGIELAEFAVRFPPTYSRLPFGTNAEKAALAQRLVTAPTRDYIRQRIPAWCDRVVWNPAALELMTGRRTTSTMVDDAFHRCAYQSVALAHTDHDGIVLFV